MEPLFPDACRNDRCAPCFYWHLKLQALNGGFHKLSDEERVFVGVETNEHGGGNRDGWHSPLANVIAQLGAQLSPAEITMLERLAGMDNPGQERLGFLGHRAEVRDVGGLFVCVF
jgi:hypothetical protein